jgi:hypothetical protein
MLVFEEVTRETVDISCIPASSQASMSYGRPAGSLGFDDTEVMMSGGEVEPRFNRATVRSISVRPASASIDKFRMDTAVVG